jgi:hypothetical protein
MGLSLKTQWTLVTSGLIAHSDAVMAGEECERLMAMLDEQAEGDEYGEWLGVISDPDRLHELLDELPELAAEHHREVLEEAWIMAIADGKRVAQEEEMLGRIAQKLGVEAVQLEFWLEAWTTAQDETATAAAHALRCVLAPQAALATADRELVVTRLQGLPTTAAHRDALVRDLAHPCPVDAVTQELTGLQKARRTAVLRAVAEVVAQAGRQEDAGPRLIALAASCSVSAARVDAWPQRA